MECFSKCKNSVFNVGTLVKVKSVCAQGHIREWWSGPLVNRMPVGNLCVTAAAYFSGCSTVKAMNFLKSANIGTISQNTFFRIQKHYVVPAISSVWMYAQAKLLKERQNRPVKLAGDGRCCSPGHTAKYGSYTLMDAECGQILCVELVQVCFRNMSRVMRKPTFCICENKDADQLRGNREADQRLCFRYINSTIPLLSKSEISSL